MRKEGKKEKESREIKENRTDGATKRKEGRFGLELFRMNEFKRIKQNGTEENIPERALRLEQNRTE